MANEMNKIYICILYIKYSCINHNNFLYLKCNFCTPKKKTEPKEKKTNNYYPKWKARKTLTSKQICCYCVLQKKKNKRGKWQIFVC